MLDRTFKREEHVFWFCVLVLLKPQKVRWQKHGKCLKSCNHNVRNVLWKRPFLSHPATCCDALRPEAAPSCFSWSGPPRRARAATLGAWAVLRLFGCLNGTSMQSTPPGHSNVCSSMGSQGPRVKRCASVDFGCLCC